MSEAGSRRELVWPHMVVPQVVAAANDASKKVIEGDGRPSDLLFLAWREAFLAEWGVYEAGMKPAVVRLAKKLAGDQADRIVFRQPLAFARDVTGKEWQCRDFVYSTAPFWFAAYFDIATAALEGLEAG